MTRRPAATWRRRAATVVVALGVPVLAAGCLPEAPGSPATDASAGQEASTGPDTSTGLLDDGAADAAVAAAPSSSALAALAEVEVKGRAPRSGYDRQLFGDAWADVDRNGCDTRNDILARDLTDETFREGTRDCVVTAGTLADPFSGRTIAFRRGQDTSEAVQIDHVVALSDAWQKGAQQLDAARRRAFANDPLNLLAVDGPLNQQKSDGDAATWLPPNRSFRCAYVARQVAVKVRYDLWATQAERNAIATVLSGCPEEPLPDGGLAAREDDRPAAAAPAPAPAANPDAPFENCAAARAAGAAPVHRGQPGYGPHLDGNSDGVGCES
jgi:hypothetical protein